MGFLSIKLCYALILLIGSFTFGWTMVYPSPAIPAIKERMEISTLEEQMFNAITALFAIIGSTVGGLLTHRIGKKNTVFATSLLASISYVSLSFLTLVNIWLGISVRALLGVVIGSYSVIIPLCVQELTPPEYAGVYSALPQFGITVGASCCYFFSGFLDWRGLTYFMCAFTGVLCVLIWVVPLAPRMIQVVDEPKESVFHEKYIKRLLVCSCIMFFQQFTGINAILTNLDTLFKNAGIDISTALASGIASSAQIIAVLIGSILLQKFGNRFVWILSSVGSAVFIMLYGLTTKFTNWPSLLPIIFIFAYVLFFGIGLGPIPWGIAPQLFPHNVRHSAASLATCVNWLSAFTVIFAFKYVVDAITEFVSMLIFMAICALSALFGWFFIETDKTPASEALLDSAPYQSIEEKIFDPSTKFM